MDRRTGADREIYNKYLPTSLGGINGHKNWVIEKRQKNIQKPKWFTANVNVKTCIRLTYEKKTYLKQA